MNRLKLGYGYTALLALALLPGCAGSCGSGGGLADFFITAGDTQTIQQGGTASYDFSVTSVNGFTGNVSLHMSNLPPNGNEDWVPVNCTVNLTANGTTGATVYIHTQLTTPTGTYMPTIDGTSGALVHHANETLIVTPPGG